jgi:hypothetical protein
MSGFEVLRLDSECMPDWRERGAVEFDRIDWQPLAEWGNTHDSAPRAAKAEEVEHPQAARSYE